MGRILAQVRHPLFEAQGVGLRTVRLYGHLGKQFGRVFRLDVRSPAEAVRALSSQINGFEKAIVSAEGVVGYRVFAGRDQRSKERLHEPCAEVESIRIVPVLVGAGDGKAWGQIIIGALMIWASSGTYGWGEALGGFAGAVQGVGIGLMVGGISQLLTKPPSAQGTTDRPENKPSYAFDGAVNTIAQGNPVPLCYGRLIVGSQVISAGLYVEQVV